MKNVNKFLVVIFVIGVFCTINSFAQIDAKATDPIKGTVIESGSDIYKKYIGRSKTSEASMNISKSEPKNPMIFCVSSDENTAAIYRLKVWRLMQGQNAETAMRTNKPIVTKDVDNVTDASAKSAKLVSNKNVTESDSDVIKACSEALQQEETSTQDNAIRLPPKQKKWLKSIYSKGVVIDDFPACAKGSSCEYIFTVEALNADGSLVNSNERKFFRVVQNENPKIYPKITPM